MEPQPPILRDLPDQFESERLIIRAPRPGDGPAANEAIRESLAELKPWFPWAQQPPAIEDTETVYRRAAAEWLQRTNFMLLLFRKSDGVFVGGSGLHRVDWSIPLVEIGYWQRTSLTGQGYMTEAVQRITRYALEEIGAQRIQIRCDVRNERSAAVARRAGYELEARMHNIERDVHSRLCDMFMFVRFPDS